MEAMRQSWTDERLDEFRESVDRQFKETNRRIDDGFARIDSRLDGLHRVLFQAAVALIVGLLGMMGAVIGLIVTQL